MIAFKDDILFKLRQNNVNLFEVSSLLVSGEQVISTYVTIRGGDVVFTDRRIIFCERPESDWEKKDFTSLFQDSIVFRRDFRRVRYGL